jgi:hypothetical protein
VPSVGCDPKGYTRKTPLWWLSLDIGCGDDHERLMNVMKYYLPTYHQNHIVKEISDRSPLNVHRICRGYTKLRDASVICHGKSKGRTRTTTVALEDVV